jgi:sulfatase modifying factor 1
MDSFGVSPKEGNIVFSEGLVMKRLRSLVAFVFLAIQAVTVHAAVVSFGTGTNKFSMEFVSIGNPGNAADTTGFPNPGGSVDYVYSIGKFEVSVDMLNKYNASQPAGGLMLYPNGYWGIHKPATVMSWNESARFVNWLNTSLGYAAAYKFTSNGHLDNISLWSETDDPLDYDPLNQYRSKRARFVLPSAHEWYKAAYYNPSDNTYYDYANGKNTAPNPSAGGTEDNTAVHQQPYLSGPADVDQAGGLSPYGVMALGGNAMEWQESSFDLRNNSVTADRVVRGGSWYRGGSYYEGLYSTAYGRLAPDNKVEYHDIGFRVVMLSSGGEVPEPSTFVIGSLLGLGGLARRRFSKK